MVDVDVRKSVFRLADAIKGVFVDFEHEKDDDQLVGVLDAGRQMMDVMSSQLRALAESGLPEADAMFADTLRTLMTTGFRLQEACESRVSPELEELDVAIEEAQRLDGNSSAS